MKTKRWLYALAVFLMLNSCGKETVDDPLEDTRWVAVEYETRVGGFNNFKESVDIHFDTDSTFVLETEINICLGNYGTSVPGTIDSFKMGDCSSNCCDPAKTIDVMAILESSNRYFYKRKKLYLEGTEGTVAFEKMN